MATQSAPPSALNNRKRHQDIPSISATMPSSRRGMLKKRANTTVAEPYLRKTFSIALKRASLRPTFAVAQSRRSTDTLADRVADIVTQHRTSRCEDHESRQGHLTAPSESRSEDQQRFTWNRHADRFDRQHYGENAVVTNDMFQACNKVPSVFHHIAQSIGFAALRIVSAQNCSIIV